MNNLETHFQTSLRNLSLKADGPIVHRGGRWSVRDRLEVWKAVGNRFFNDDLDRFAETAIKVLGECDPQFDLTSEERFASYIYGKVLKHSPDLRQGIAETLALLGTNSDCLKSCTPGKAEYIAGHVVNTLLDSTDPRAWASLNDVFPLLAEAAPEAFLTSIEKSLKNHATFEGIFAEEGAGIAGRNYMTGLLWGLETLAWSSDYFARALMILAELATFDPGGQWANRPSNSLWAVLLPWFPQTLASIEKRIASVEMVCKEFPDVGWNLVLALLPQTHQSSTNNPRPNWRQCIPPDWKEGSSDEDYWKQVDAYAAIALSIAKNDPSKLRTLVGHIGQLPPKTRENLIEYLGSIDKADLSVEHLLEVWNELTGFVTRHRKYSDARWAWPSLEVDRLRALADKLEPESPALKYRRLFVRNEFDLNEETQDFEKGRQNLEEKRVQAIREIYDVGGLEAVIDFSITVETSDRVGVAFTKIATEKDEFEMLSRLLASERSSDINFAGGYVWAKFQDGGWEWLQRIDQATWLPSQKARLLSFLPFNSATWSAVDNVLGADSDKYWSMTWGNPYDIHDGNYETAIRNLLKVDRVAKAIEILSSLYYRQIKMPPGLIVEVLEQTSQKDAEYLGSSSITDLIGALQNSDDIDESKVIKIEWKFLRLLDGFHASPRILYRRLAQSPETFCEVIEAIYGGPEPSEMDDTELEVQQRVASNAYRLIHDWKVVPGLDAESKLDGDKLKVWIDEVRERCSVKGTLGPAMSHVGHSLFYAPSDPDGLWLHRSVAEILNEKDADKMRSGFQIEAFNSRGVFTVDPEGKAETGIADAYRNKAELIELAGYHRVATSLREIAADFDAQARQHRREAEKLVE